LNDLDPVALLPSSAFLLVARTSIPAKSLEDLVAWAKARPKPLSAGTPGVGSIPQMAGILRENLTGVRLQFVPYRGAAPAAHQLHVAFEFRLGDFQAPFQRRPDPRAARAYG